MEQSTDTNKNVAAYTPEIVAKNELKFSIPIYQRLFEWNKETIYTLLDGILISMLKEKEDEGDYYIGMLTSTKIVNNLLKLVDGQQRFTVMTLMAITFMHSNCHVNNWKKFLLLNEKLRLDFESRESDVKFLNEIIVKNESYDRVLDYARLEMKAIPEGLPFINKKMAAGLYYIKSYLDTINYQLTRLEYNDSNVTCAKISEYIFKHLKFFITELPEYEVKDLNLYFERMNSAGKNLESHEILKVKMLDKIQTDDSENYTYYVKAWDTVADMDTRVFIRRSGKNKEDASRFRTRCLKSLSIIRKKNPIWNIFTSEDENAVINAAFNNDGKGDSDTSSDNNTIKSIIQRNPELKAPSDDDHRDVPFISLLTFPRFLLQVLYYYSLYILNDDDCKKYNLKSVRNGDEFKVNEFFNESNLLSTFDQFLPEDKYLDYVNTLFALRVLYDFYVIRIKNSDDSYTLLMSRGLSGDSRNDEDDDDDNNIEFAKLREFESMLYVNSVNVTYYRWLPELLHYVYSSKDIGANGDLVSPSYLLDHLKSVDNKTHKDDLKENSDDNNLDALSYRFIDRYWFWRLDYYFWEEVVDKRRIVQDYQNVKNFRFRRNRSIEHLHPQDESNNTSWGNKKRINSFFNLAMISQGFNSTQSNDSVRVKFARIKDTINDLESLKMYHMYISADKNDENWTLDKAKSHGEEMIEILIKSFPDNDEFGGIRNQLIKIKINNCKLF